MKKSLIMNLMLLALMSISITACSKYEEGPASLTSKKKRVVNHWRTQQLTINGVDVTSSNIVTDINVKSNNTIIVSGEVWGFPYSTTGGWVFNAKKTNVLVTNSDGTLDDYEIIMLQKDESKFRRVDENDDVIFYHFVTY